MTGLALGFENLIGGAYYFDTAVKNIYKTTFYASFSLLIIKRGRAF